MDQVARPKLSPYRPQQGQAQQAPTSLLREDGVSPLLPVKLLSLDTQFADSNQSLALQGAETEGPAQNARQSADPGKGTIQTTRQILSGKIQSLGKDGVVRLQTSLGIVRLQLQLATPHASTIAKLNSGSVVSLLFQQAPSPTQRQFFLQNPIRFLEGQSNFLLQPPPENPKKKRKETNRIEAASFSTGRERIQGILINNHDGQTAVLPPVQSPVKKRAQTRRKGQTAGRAQPSATAGNRQQHTLQPGSRLLFQLADYRNPQSDTFLQDQGNIVEAEVIGPLHSGTLLQSDLGDVFIPKSLDLPKGEALLLQLLRLSPPLSQTTQGQASAFEVFSQDLLQAQARLAAYGQKAAIPQSLPTTGANLSQGLLFFLSILQGSSVAQDSWQGSPLLRALQSLGQDTLFSRLSDLGALSRALPEASTGEWRLYSLPLWLDNKAEEVRFYIKGQPDHDNDRKEKITRFKIELLFSRDGEMQFDGFVKEKKFDLVLRSGRRLDEGLERSLKSIFYESLGALGFRGEITFQPYSQWSSPLLKPANP